MANITKSKAAPYNFVVDKYASHEVKLTWRTGGNSPQPVPFTGARALLQVRSTIDEQDVLFEASNTNGRIILHPTSGLITIFFSDVDTANMQFEEGVYDMIVRLASGKVYRPIQGSFTVVNGVSRFT